MTPAETTPGSVPPPWGALTSIAWGAVSIAAWFVAQFAVILAYISWAGPDADVRKLGTNGFLLALSTVMAGPAWVGVLAYAARLRGWRARDYLALVPPRRSEILFGLACLAPLLIAFDLLALALGRDVVPSFMREAYLSAQASGSLVLFFLAVVVVGPVAEEVAFRGFLFRGLSVSWFGLAGTLVATSAIWAAMHIQYDWIVAAQIFLIGLVLGWLRWASGSTLLTILLHVITNFVATLQAAIKVEWMG